MNRYLITHRIFTIAEIYEAFSYHGFRFSPWNYDPRSGTCGDHWVATKEMLSDTPTNAFREFIVDFERAMDRIAFVSQCYCSTNRESFILQKLNDNSQNIFYFQYALQANPVPLHFNNEELQALEALESYEEKGDVFRYLREACAGTSFYTRCTMLISALEAIAGEENSPKGHKRTNTDYIKTTILQDDTLFDQLYAYGSGLRIQLMHGKHLDNELSTTEDIDFIGDIYRAILRYFLEKCGADISQDVVHPMRGPLGNYKTWKSWLEPLSSDIDINLFNVHSLFLAETEQYDDKPPISFNEAFRVISTMPKDY